MLDAFKAPQKSNELPENKMADGGVGVRKSLVFDETAAMVGFEEAPMSSSEVLDQGKQSPMEKMRIDTALESKNTGSVEGEQVTASGEAGLEEDGVLLSDSELLDEEWEEGEVPEFMEEMEEVPTTDEPIGQVNEDINSAVTNETEETGAKAKKKSTKTGTGTRLVHKLLSPRKNKIAKPNGRNGDGRKATTKP